MNIIKLQVKDFEIIPLEKQYVVENQVNEFAIDFEFDDTWNFDTKYVIFDNEETTYKRPIIDNRVIIPSELLNGRTTIQIYGQNVEDGEIVKRKPSYKYSFSILNSLSTEGQEESDLPKPTQWEIYISQIETMLDGFTTDYNEFKDDITEQFNDLKEDCETKCDDVIERLEKDEQDIQTNTDNIRTNAENIDKLNTDLLDYSLITETGNKISMSINPNTYVITLSLKDKNDNVLSTQSVDLPLETMIISASYSNGVLTFTLKNGQTLEVPISDLISGLVSTDTFNQAVQGLSNRITTIENDYLKSTDKTELQNQITQNADDIDDIQEEQLTQNADIESLQQENERLQRIVSGLPTKNASGTNIVLNDMVKANIKDYELRGNTAQTTTTGKNIFNKNSITNDSWLVENGTISTGHPGYVVSDYIPIAPNTQYYKGNNGSPRNKYYDINKQPLDTSTYQDISIGGNAGTFTTPNNAYYLRITINGANADINNLQIEEGSSSTSYEEYTGGVPSPNPNYPQAIQTVTGNQTIQCCGVNVYEPIINTQYLNGLTPKVENDGSISVKGISTASWSNICALADIYLEAGTYTFSLSKTYNFRCGIRCYTNKEKTTYETMRIDAGQTKNTKTFTSKIYGWYLYIGEYDIGTEFDDNFKVQIEIGNTATSFEKYNGTTFPISLGTIELNKIGDYQDKIYKSNGKWYLEKNIEKITLNGSEDWLYDTTGNYFFISNTEKYYKPNSICISDRFIYGEVANTDNSIKVGNWYFPMIKYTQCSTATEFKQWLSTHNTIVYYILATPTTTEITDENLISQLEDIYNIILNENNTIIINGNLPSDTLVIGYADIAKLISSLSSQDNRSVVEENTRKGGNTEEPKEEKKPIEEPIETKEEER